MAELRSGFQKTEKEMKSFLNTLQPLESQMVTFGTVSSGAFKMAMSSAARYASELDTASKRMSTAVAELARLSNAAGMAQTTLGQLGSVLSMGSDAVTLATGLGKLVAKIQTLAQSGKLAGLALGLLPGIAAAVAVGVVALGTALSNTNNHMARLKERAAEAEETVAELAAKVADSRARVAEAAERVKQHEEAQHQERLEMANRFGAALMSAIRKRYEEEEREERKGQQQAYNREVEALNKRLQSARDIYHNHVQDLGSAIEGEITRLRRANEDKERLHDEALRNLIAAKRAEIDALDDAIEEEDAVRRQQDRQRQRAMIVEEMQHTTYRPRVAELQTQLDELDFEERREAAEKEIAARREELEDEIELERRKAEEARITRQREFEDSTGEYRQYLQDVADGAQVVYSGALTAEQDAFVGWLTGKRSAIEEDWQKAEEEHEKQMEVLAQWNEDEIARIDGKYEQLKSDYNVFNESMTMLTSGQHAQILALLNKYEPGWRTQGKSFVDMMVAGIDEEFPSLVEIAAKIGIVQDAAAGEVKRIKQSVQDARAAMAELRAATADLEEDEENLERAQKSRDKIIQEIREGIESGDSYRKVYDEYRRQQESRRAETPDLAYALGGWVPADGLAMVHKGELVLPPEVASFFKRVGVPAGASGTSQTTNHITVHADIANRYDIEHMFEDLEYVASRRQSQRVGASRG